MYKSRLYVFFVILTIPLWLLPVILYVGGRTVLPELWIELSNKNTWRYLLSGDKKIPFVKNTN